MDNQRNNLESLTKNFTNEVLTQFLRAASGKFRPDVKDYSHYLETATKVRTLQKIGQIDFEDKRRLIVLSGETDNELTSHSGKLKQYVIAKNVLKNENLDAGIFVFYDSASNFRFSWITASYTGTKREFSSFRRYTYFVSPDQPARTFLDQLGKKDVFASPERITEAFSVEPVTTEFFRKYREIFEETEATIKLRWSDEKKRIYTQRFFNRVMFIAFLERKGWLVFNGRKDYLKALFADYYENETNKNLTFHRSRLNTLFFMGLNHPSGDKRKDPAYKPILSQIGDVPYLNGGLFDEEDEDKDGPVFPDNVVAKIISELVYQFNFTVTESTPLDIEVAVDPEMLGRIFEELVTGRHESGSYYTPKSVVAFMCRETLKGYLENAMPSESKEALETFVDKNDAKELKNPELALNALRLVKVCDPACGSGAYLLGMLHELLEQRECLFAARHLDPTTIYERKLEIIQNNLYGVDKDDFAVNIARLRLWLSLIVDYEGETPPPLPNLDFKIECGDSLTAPDPSGGLEPDLFRYSQIQEFVGLKNEFQNLHSGQKKKKELFEKIKSLRDAIEKGTHKNKIEGFDWAVEFAEVFAPELAQDTLSGKMAGVVNTTKGQMELTGAPKEGGFDIVIGNPPYVQLQKDGGRLAKMFEKAGYNTFERTGDIYSLFYERGWQMLKNKGLLCFITSNKWMRAGYGESTRKFFAEHTNPILLIDFAGQKIFQSATVDVNILMFSKDKNQQKTLAYIVKEDVLNELSVFVRQQGSISSFTNANSWIILSDIEQRIKEKIERIGTPLKEWDIQINYGIKTGFNDAFIIDGAKRKELITQDPKSDEIIRPILRGRDIKRYSYEFADLWLLFIPWHFPLHSDPSIIGASDKAEKAFKSEYPAIYNHLLSYKKELENRNKAETGVRYEWYALQRWGANYMDDFNRQKIVWGNLNLKASYAIAPEGFFVSAPCPMIVPASKYLLAILNSKLADYFIRKLGVTRNGGYFEYKPMFIEQLPVPNVSEPEQNKIASLVQENPTLESDKLLNKAIYQLYNLTIEEIRFIEAQ